VWRALTPVDDAVVSASGFGSWENDGAKPEFFFLNPSKIQRTQARTGI
jgi:hypothetical protein